MQKYKCNTAAKTYPASENCEVGALTRAIWGFNVIQVLRYVFTVWVVPVGTGSVSDVVLFPLSYTAQAVFGIDKRNQEDYVLRLPTQSFDQRPGSIRRSTLILPLYLLLVPVLFSASLLTSLLTVWGIIEPCGTAVGFPLLSCQKLEGGRSNAFETQEKLKS